MENDRESKPDSLARALGLTRKESQWMKRAIQFCEISGPHRWTMGDPIQLRGKDCAMKDPEDGNGGDSTPLVREQS